MSGNELKSETKTLESEINALHGNTIMALEGLNFKAIDSLFEKLKNGEGDDLGTENAFISAINNHPETVSLSNTSID